MNQITSSGRVVEQEEDEDAVDAVKRLLLPAAVEEEDEDAVLRLLLPSAVEEEDAVLKLLLPAVWNKRKMKIMLL